MLYNPKWERIWSIAGFSAWLNQQPRWKRYDFTDPQNCAVAQYMKAMDMEPSVSCDRLRELGWMNIVNTGCRRSTFGGAARRARIVQAGGWRLRIAQALAIV